MPVRFPNVRNTRRRPRCRISGGRLAALQSCTRRGVNDGFVEPSSVPRKLKPHLEPFIGPLSSNTGSIGSNSFRRPGDLPAIGRRRSRRNRRRHFGGLCSQPSGPYSSKYVPKRYATREDLSLARADSDHRRSKSPSRRRIRPRGFAIGKHCCGVTWVLSGFRLARLP
jgi:hypothetical protein